MSLSPHPDPLRESRRGFVSRIHSRDHAAQSGCREREVDQSGHCFRRESSAAELGRKCPPEFGGVLDFGCAIRFFDSPSTHASDNPAPRTRRQVHRARCQVAARHSGLHGLPSLRETPGFVEQIPAYVAAPVEGEKIPVIAWAVGTEHQPIRRITPGAGLIATPTSAISMPSRYTVLRIRRRMDIAMLCSAQCLICPPTGYFTTVKVGTGKYARLFRA